MDVFIFFSFCVSCYLTNRFLLFSFLYLHTSNSSHPNLLVYYSFLFVLLSSHNTAQFAVTFMHKVKTNENILFDRIVVIVYYLLFYIQSSGIITKNVSKQTCIPWQIIKQRGCRSIFQFLASIEKVLQMH